MAGRPATDHSGKRYGMLAVLRKEENVPDKHVYWRCACDCGRQHIVAGWRLTAGRTRSCGCQIGAHWRKKR